MTAVGAPWNEKRLHEAIARRKRHGGEDHHEAGGNQVEPVGRMSDEHTTFRGDVADCNSEESRALDEGPPEDPSTPESLEAGHRRTRVADRPQFPAKQHRTDDPRPDREHAVDEREGSKQSEVRGVRFRNRNVEEHRLAVHDRGEGQDAPRQTGLHDLQSSDRRDVESFPKLVYGYGHRSPGTQEPRLDRRRAHT